MSHSNYYLKKGDKSVGPLTFDRLASLREQGKIQSDALVAESAKGPWFTWDKLEASVAPVVAEEVNSFGGFDLGSMLPPANAASPTHSNWNASAREPSPSVPVAISVGKKSTSTFNFWSFIRKILGVGIMAIGMLSGLLFFSGSYQMQRASARMSEIRSRGGETIDEAYFHQVGEQGGAASTALVACGFAIIGISVGLGGLLICLPNEESV